MTWEKVRASDSSMHILVGLIESGMSKFRYELQESLMIYTLYMVSFSTSVHHRLSSVAFSHSNSHTEFGVKIVKHLIADNTAHDGDLDTDTFQHEMLQHRQKQDGCQSIQNGSYHSQMVIVSTYKISFISLTIVRNSRDRTGITLYK